MINPWVAARTFLIVSDSPNAFSYLRKGLLFYVVTICPSAVHPVGCYYFTNSNNYQSSIPSEWNVDAECPRRYSKVFVYYNCVFTSTEKSNFVAVWNLVGGVTCITGKTVTILLITYFPISIHWNTGSWVLIIAELSLAFRILKLISFCVHPDMITI